MHAEEYLQTGDLDQALETLQADIRANPSKAALRVFRLGGETPVAAGLGAVEAELPSGTYRLQASLPGRSDLDTKARVLARQVTEVTYQGDRKVGDRP